MVPKRRQWMAQTRLKQLREEAVLTVHELAEASGVSDDTISKIENGQRVARPSTLRKLARALNVSPQELRRPAKTEELAGAGKDEAPREAGLDIAKLPGLDAALRRHGMGRGALAHRAGMTPGELFDYEVGEKKPSDVIVTRLADALGCFK